MAKTKGKAKGISAAARGLAEFWTVLEVEIPLEKRVADFLAAIANMTKDNEIKGGLSADHNIERLHNLIDNARALTGIDPKHQTYCLDCGRKAIGQRSGQGRSDSAYCRRCQ